MKLATPQWAAFVLLFFHTFASQTYGQGTPTAPDCQISGNLLAVTNTTPVSSITCSFNQTGVWVWTATYYVDGFSAVSVTVQSAQDNNGAPGTWGTFSGSVNSSEGCGANPCTVATSSFIVLTGYNPWVRVILNSATGSGAVHVTLYGSRNPGSGGGAGTGGGGGGSGCVGTAMTPCVVDGPTASGSTPTTPPVLTAGWDATNLHTLLTDTSGRQIAVGAAAAGAAVAGNPVLAGTYDGTNAQRLRSDLNGRILQGSYSTNAAISLSASGLTQIIASGANTITVAHYSISFASGVNFQLEYGTGSNCATGTTALTGVYQSVASIAIDTPFQVPSGQALCANLGSAVTGGGFIVYSIP